MTAGDFLAQATRCRAEDETLTDVAVRDADFSGLDFSGLELAHSSFTHCRFGGCDLSGAVLSEVGLEGCDLSNARLSGVRWDGCTLTACKAVGAEFREGHFLRTAFCDCLLRYANFSSAKFTAVSWTDCVLAGAILASCALGAEFHRCDLKEVSFFRTPLKGLNLSSCQLDGLVVSDSGEELRGLTVDLWQAAGLARRLGILIQE